MKTSSPPVENFDGTPGKVLNNKDLREAYKSKKVIEITYIHALFEKVENKSSKNIGNTRSDAALHNKNTKCDTVEY